MRLIAQAGSRNAVSHIRSFAPVLNSFITSSRNTIPSSGSIPALERNRREVRIVLMSHRSLAVIMDSRPAVKFKSTGTFPGSDSLTVRGESLASHRDRRGAPVARRDDREYREYLSEEQRSHRGCIAGRMQPDFHHGLVRPARRG